MAQEKKSFISQYKTPLLILGGALIAFVALAAVILALLIPRMRTTAPQGSTNPVLVDAVALPVAGGWSPAMWGAAPLFGMAAGLQCPEGFYPCFGHSGATGAQLLRWSIEGIAYGHGIGNG